jgi:hypothetical protein
MSQPTLLTKLGDSRTLPLILLSDYLGAPVELKTAKHFNDEDYTFYEKLPMLQIGEHQYIQTPASMLRYACRVNSSKLYDESSHSVNEAETLLNYVFQELTYPLNTLNKKSWKNKEDKKKLKELKGNLSNSIKNIAKLVGGLKGELNVADFAVFGVLGCVNDKDLKKLAKSQK